MALQTKTSTQIRTLYSEGYSYMSIRFYNTNLTISMNPFEGKQPNGISMFSKNGVFISINYDQAYALNFVANEILNDRYEEEEITINISDASISLSKKLVNGVPEVILSINRNNLVVPFKFITNVVQVKENGNIINKIVFSGLGVFAKTLEGYLTGINADRHLDKLTEDYAKLMESGNSNSQQNNYNSKNNNVSYKSRGKNQYQNNNYNNNNNYNKGYNNYNDQNLPF